MNSPSQCFGIMSTYNYIKKKLKCLRTRCLKGIKSQIEMSLVVVRFGDVVRILVKRLYFSGKFEDRSRKHQSKPRQFPTRDVATSDIFRDVSSCRKLDGRVVRNDTSERAISTQPTSILHVCTFSTIRKHIYSFDWKKYFTLKKSYNKPSFILLNQHLF